MMAVSDRKLERYALGALSPEEMRAVHSALRTEPGGLARLAALHESNHETLMMYPPRMVVPKLRTWSGTSRNRRLTLLVPVVAMAVGLFAIVPGTSDPPATPGPDTYVGVKGEPRLLISRQVTGGDEDLFDQQSASAGDIVQLSYQAMGSPYGVIVSLDGAGAVTLHHPMDGGSTALDPEGRVALESAYKLDAAPDFERFFLVTSEDPISAEEVVGAVRDLVDPTHELALPDPLEQTSVTLRKVP